MPDRKSLQQQIREAGCISREHLDREIGLRRHPDGMGSVYAQVKKDLVADVVPGTVLILTYAVVSAVDYCTGVISLDFPDFVSLTSISFDKESHG